MSNHSACKAYTRCVCVCARRAHLCSFENFHGSTMAESSGRHVHVHVFAFVSLLGTVTNNCWHTLLFPFHVRMHTGRRFLHSNETKSLHLEK